MTLIPLGPSRTPPEGSGPPDAVLLSRDLIFTAKIVGTAEGLGYRVETVGDPTRAARLIEQGPPRLVFVDLAAGDLASPAVLTDLRRLAPATTFLAFGSHVDTAALAAASAAGCDPVMPRSKFSANLPDLIRRYLGG